MNTTDKLLLCVEDDHDDSLWIGEISAEVDPKIVFVAKPNGRDALLFLDHQKEQNHLPCLILLDLNMPLMDGKETLLAIKKDPELREIPVVVFTTSSSKKDELFCEKHGAEMITKPQSFPGFKRTIKHLVLSRCI